MVWECDVIIVEARYLFFVTHLTLTTKEEDIPGFLMFQKFLPNVFYKTHMKIVHKFQ